MVRRRGPNMATVAKALTAFLTTLATWGYTAFEDNKVEGAEWFGLCGVAVAALAVYAIPNEE